jgi:uncharacterized protein YuzB (UPF0349 family)
MKDGDDLDVIDFVILIYYGICWEYNFYGYGY